MSADRLRAAAKTLRERAGAATPPADPQPGGWMGSSVDGTTWLFGGPAEHGYRTTTIMHTDESCDECYGPDGDDMDYIATMHPGVALALADWLDAEAATATPRGLDPHVGPAAVAVADAILGGEDRG